jgi:hypothetical protein
MNTTTAGEHGSSWLQSTRIFLGVSAFGHLIWEIVQLPLYVIWSAGTGREIAIAIVHCLAGDLLIAVLSLVAALVCFGSPAWPRERFIQVLAATLVIGVGYTVYSEWLNTTVRKAWAYSELMPTLPMLGTGLSPLLQWLIVPMFGFAAMLLRRGRPQP